MNNLEINVEADNGDLIRFRITHFVPVRPAPYCSDPSNPRYSDCGDEEEIEYEPISICGTDGTIRLSPAGINVEEMFGSEERLYGKISGELYQKILEKKLEF